MSYEMTRKGRRKGRRRQRPRRRAGNGTSSGTTTISLKTIAMSFPPFSNERVLIHGLWQKSRGRQPCQPAHNQRNPQLAFAAARGYLDARSIIEAFREKYRLQWMYAHATEF